MHLQPRLPLKVRHPGQQCPKTGIVHKPDTAPATAGANEELLGYSQCEPEVGCCKCDSLTSGGERPSLPSVVALLSCSRPSLSYSTAFDRCHTSRSIFCCGQESPLSSSWLCSFLLEVAFRKCCPFNHHFSWGVTFTCSQALHPDDASIGLISGGLTGARRPSAITCSFACGTHLPHTWPCTPVHLRYTSLLEADLPAVAGVAWSPAMR